jgi:hypothetical protein
MAAKAILVLLCDYVSPGSKAKGTLYFECPQLRFFRGSILVLEWGSKIKKCRFSWHMFIDYSWLRWSDPNGSSGHKCLRKLANSHGPRQPPEKSFGPPPPCLAAMID